MTMTVAKLWKGQKSHRQIKRPVWVYDINGNFVCIDVVTDVQRLWRSNEGELEWRSIVTHKILDEKNPAAEDPDDSPVIMPLANS